MTDIPSAAVWTAVLVAIGHGEVGGSLGGGALAAIGILLRPNLAPLALVTGLFVRGKSSGFGARVTSMVLFFAPIAVGALAIAALNTRWYGAPWLSGYGGAGYLYSAARVLPNAARYFGWLWLAQSPLVIAAVIPLFPLKGASQLRARLLPGYVLFAATLACYLPYFEYDAWAFVRFLLPALGAIAVATSAGFLVLLGPNPVVRSVAGGLVFAAVVSHSFRLTSDAGAYTPSSERRYVDVGHYLSRTLPPSAVVIAMQHSGSARFYGGRYTLRYDGIEPGSQEQLLSELRRLGYRPYLVAEDWELPDVRRRFAVANGSPLPWQLSARLENFGGVSVFDMTALPGGSVQAIPSREPIHCEASAPLRLEAAK